MSWWSMVSGWLNPARSVGDAGDAGELAEMRRRLREEQRALSSDVENLFRAYDEKVRHLSSRLQQLSPEELRAEADDIRTTQDALKRLLRRAEASTKTSRQLERDLASWESRSSDEELHADHPLVRAEVIRSELASRDPEGYAVPPRCSSSAVLLDEDEVGAEEPAARDVSIGHPGPEDVEFLPELDAANLVAAIRDATREAERWHAVPTEDHDEETLAQLHHVRDLHAILKRLDRRQGIRRDRLEFAIRTNEQG